MENGSVDISEDSAASAPKRSSLDIVLLLSTLALAAVIIAGRIWVNNNEVCLRFIGCGKGFFGYDAIEHFLGGMLISVLVIWLCNRFPKHTLLNGNPRANLLIILAVVVFVGVGWEMLEFLHDHMLREFAWFDRLLLLRQSMLFQPSNTDTMGDLTIDLLGGILGILVLNTNLLNNTNRDKNTNTTNTAT